MKLTKEFIANKGNCFSADLSAKENNMVLSWLLEQGHIKDEMKQVLIRSFMLNWDSVQKLLITVNLFREC
jgi:hypothetical protein